MMTVLPTHSANAGVEYNLIRDIGEMMDPRTSSTTECGRLIQRRTMLKMTGGLVGYAALAQSVAAASGIEKPNIVFLLADDLGWADTAVYGGDLVETPNLKRLADSGVRFTDAYAAAPVCSPTRASLMTGKYPARLHMTTWYEASQDPPLNKKLIPPKTVGDLPLTENNVAKALHEQGYLTAHLGKWHLGSAGYYPENQGFDIDIGGTFWGAPQTHFYPYKGNKYWGGEARYVPHMEWGHRGEYLADQLTDDALDVMTRAKDQPFYLNLWYYSVHVPAEAPAALVEKYKKKLRPGLHHNNATYAAMVADLDNNIGRVLDHIDKLGIAERTIVIFGSDNGGYIGNWNGEQVTSNSPLRSGKGSLYEGGIRVPLIVRWPGVTPAGAVCNEPVISNDLFPTVLDMTGELTSVPYEKDDGRSLAPLLKNSRATLGRKTLFFHYPHYYETTTPVGAIREGPWKLLEYFEDWHCELYDLRSDIGERHDLAQEHPRKVAELRDKLHAWRQSVNAQMPQRNPSVAETTPENRWDAHDCLLAEVD